jgi:ligand-binding sensor domain-containing protein
VDGGGLMAFDGEQWSPYAADFPSAVEPGEAGKAESLSYNVHALLLDANGGLWVGTDDGLGLYKDGQWASFTEEDGLPGLAVYALHQDGSVIWAGLTAGWRA